MRIVKSVWWLCLYTSMSCSCLALQAGQAEGVRHESLFFHNFNLVGSPIAGNRIAVDEEGRVYFQTMRTVWSNNVEIPLSWDGGYLVYSQDGELLGEFWGGINGMHLTDMNVMNGKIYTPCISVGPWVYVFNAEGHLIRQISIPQSRSVSGAPDNSIWVVNQPAKRVEHYDQFGKFLGAIPSGSTADQYPLRVRVSPTDGRIYIDTVGVGIEIYSPQGDREGKIPDGPLYNCTTDGNVVAGFAIYSPTGEKIKDIRLENFTYQVHDIAVDPDGNIYLAVKDSLNALGFVSYDAEGRFRFARGSDFERMEVVLPSRVLEPGKTYDISITFGSGRDKGYLTPGQILPGDKRELPSFSAFLKDIRGEEWIPVELIRDEADRYILRLAKMLVSGVYTLRLTTVAEAEPIGAPALRCDFLILVPASGTLGSITLFSDRNRSVWRCGETVPFSIVVRSREKLTQAKFQVELNGIRPVKNLSIDVNAGSNTVSLVIPSEVTSALCPGDYTVICREADTSAGNFAESRWGFHLVSSIQSTRFKMTHYPEMMEDDLTARTAVSSVGIIARRGFNHDVRAVYAIASRREDINLCAPISAEVEQLGSLLGEDPHLPTPEVLYQRHRFEQYLEETTKYGIDSRIQLIFNEHMLPYLPEMWSNEQRQVQIFTQFASRYPSFAGWSFTGHAHVQSFVEGDLSNKTLARAREQFVKQFGATPEEKSKEWFEHYNRFIPATYHAWDKAASQVNPSVVDTASPGEHISAVIGKYPPWIYEPFRLQLTHVQEEQWHEQTIYPFMTDFVRRPGKPLVSLHSHLHESENGQYIGREYFLALSRGLQGVGISQSALQSLYASVVPYAPYSSLHELFTIYGDFFYALQPANDIAILMSYSQDRANGIKNQGWGEQVIKVFELYTTALYAHLPVSIVYEEDIASLKDDNTSLIKPKAVLITGLKTNLPPNVLQGLAAFQSRGGIVFVDADTTVDIDGARRIPLDFNELWGFLSKSLTYWNSDSWRTRVESACLPKALSLREVIGTAIPLVVNVDNPRCIIGLQQYGNTKYLFLANMDALPMRPEQMWHFTTYEPTTLPAKPTITLSGTWKNYAIYDLFSGRKVDTVKQGNAVTFQADLTSILGRVYALLPDSIGGVFLSAPRNISLGNILPIEVHVMTAGNEPFHGLVPVEITLLDAAGNAMETVYRAVTPDGLRCELPTFLNGPGGDIHIQVRELITGYGAEASVTAFAQTLPETFQQSPEVDILNANAIHRFLTTNKRLAILCEEEHTALKPAVEILSMSLSTSKKDIQVLNAKAFHATKESFDGVIIPWMPDCRSPYFAQLEQLNSMPRRLSPNWPGHGRGVLEIVFAPRKYGENMVILAGGDMNGLSQAITRVAQIITGVELPPGVPSNKSQTLVHGKVLPRQLLPDRARSMFGPMFIEAAVSPNGQYVGLASQSWGNNLFLLDKNGKVLSTVMAGKDFPSPIGMNIINRYLTVLDSGDLYTRIADLESPFLFLGHYRSGKLIERYAMMGLRHIGPADAGTMTRANDCSFTVAPDGTVISAGNYGVIASSSSSSELWREDYWQTYQTLDSLIAKMTADIAVSPDGKFVAIIRQREVNSWANPRWKPSLMASVRELHTGKEVWNYTFPKGMSFAKLLATNGKQMVFQTDETLVCLDTGKVAWKYESPIFVHNYYPGIYHPYMKAISHDVRHVLIGGKEGSIIFVEGGRTMWGDYLQDSVFDIDINVDASRMAASSADGMLVCYDGSGKRLWTQRLPSHAALSFMGDMLVTADARGIVRYFDAQGIVITSVDMAPYTWRPSLVQELTMTETAPVRKASMPEWQETVIPAGKINLATAARIEVRANEGWYSSGLVQNRAWILKNGKVDDVEQPWLSLNECYWDASAQRLPQVRVNFDKPTIVQAVRVKEHSAHPDAVPREIAIEVQQEDGTWKTVRTDVNVSGITHTHTFAEVMTKAIRYTIVADLFNNFWTTEIEVY